MGERAREVIAGRWFITPHAVRRYIERVDRRAGYEQALAELVRFSEVARPVKEISPGVWLFRSGKPLRLRFRVATDQRDGEAPQLLTVMAGHDRGWRRLDDAGRLRT
jgi:hypothetical protein